MTQEELKNVFKYIVKKCDMLINNGNYKADTYTQDTVEDIAELCNHILDGNYGKLVEAKNVDLEKEIRAFAKMDLYPIELEDTNESLLITKHQIYKCARHFFELGLKVQKGE